MIQKFPVAPTIVEESSTSFYPVDPPPCYAEAMEYVQLSTRQLTQAMVDKQWNRRQNTSAGADNDQDEDFVKETKKKKTIKYVAGQLYLFYLFLSS